MATFPVRINLSVQQARDFRSFLHEVSYNTPQDADLVEYLLKELRFIDLDSICPSCEMRISDQGYCRCSFTND